MCSRWKLKRWNLSPTGFTLLIYDIKNQDNNQRWIYYSVFVWMIWVNCIVIHYYPELLFLYFYLFTRQINEFKKFYAVRPVRLNNFNYNPGLVAALYVIKCTRYWGILTARYIVSTEPCENVVTPNDSRIKIVGFVERWNFCACKSWSSGIP